MLKKRQCELNIRNAFLHYGLPQLKLIETREDRCFFEFNRDFLARLIEKKGFFVNDIKKGGWRENVRRCSMEVYLHDEPFLGRINGRRILYSRVIEVDFDYWNPMYGLYPLVRHGIECLINYLLGRKTDPFKIRKGLVRRGIAVPKIDNKESILYNVIVQTK